MLERQPGRPGIGGQPVDPFPNRMRCHPPQHRVGERPGPGTGLRLHQVDGGVDGGVVRHPHGQQLVRPQTQGIEHLRLDLGQWAVDAGGQHRVVQALHPQRRRSQLGGEGGVAAGQAVGGKRVRQRQVRVGVIDPHCTQHLVGREPGGIQRHPAALAAGWAAALSHRTP